MLNNYINFIANKALDNLCIFMFAYYFLKYVDYIDLSMYTILRISIICLWKKFVSSCLIAKFRSATQIMFHCH